MVSGLDAISSSLTFSGGNEKTLAGPSSGQQWNSPCIAAFGRRVFNMWLPCHRRLDLDVIATETDGEICYLQRIRIIQLPPPFRTTFKSMDAMGGVRATDGEHLVVLS